MKILVCNPAQYDVKYSINPWMDPKHGINFDLAIKQWGNLVRTMRQLGAEIVEMSGKENLPDIVFTANAGVNFGKYILLSNFKHPERQPEKQIYKEWFENHGYSCKELPEDIFFEGAGDVLCRKNSKNIEQLYLGYGFRTDFETFSDISFLDLHSQKMQLVDPYFYHLDTCFCPLPRDFALIYSKAFSEQTILNLKSSRPSPVFLEVPEEEARKFACNAVSINNSVIIPSGCHQTRKLLNRYDFDVYETDMSEFILAGGACKCLTFKLDCKN